MEDMFGHLPDAQPSDGGGMFDHLPSVSPEDARRAQYDAQIAKEAAMSPADYEQYAMERVKQGHAYRPQPARGQGFAYQIQDPLKLRDELEGIGAGIGELFKSGFDLTKAGAAYTDAAETARAEQRYAREQNGVIPEIAGGLVTSGPTKLLSAATAAPSYLKSLGQSAAVGAGYGAASGFAQGEGEDATSGVVNRLVGAGEGALTGGVLAPALTHGVIPAAARTYGGLKAGLRYGNNAVRSALNPEQTAIEAVADRMVDSGLDPAAARAAVTPQLSSQLQGRVNPKTGQNFTAADTADIISRSLKGESASSIGADYGLADSTVRSYVTKHAADNPTPMNIIDIAKEQLGEGASQPLWRLGRAANTLAGDESKDAAQALLNRQEDQPGRVSGIIRQSVGNRDFEKTLELGIQNLKTEAGKAYRGFNAEPDLATNQLSDLMEDPLFREAMLNGQKQARVEVMKQNIQLKKAGKPEEPVPTADPEAQVFSPQTLDYIQRQLRLKSQGFASDPNAAAHARNLREVFLDRIEQHYPTFKPIREQYAQMKGEYGEEGALQAGRDLSTRLGDKTDEALRGFASMTPAQKELFRLGFARSLLDQTANPQIGGAVANRFNTTAVREIVGKLYSGDKTLQKQGAALIRNLRREAITTKTKNDVLAGSRTAELQSDASRLMEGAKTAADIATGRFANVIGNLATRLTTQIGRRGAAEVTKVLTETDPAELLPLLNRLAQAAKSTKERREYVMAIRELRAFSAPIVSGEAGRRAGSYMAKTH